MIDLKTRPCICGRTAEEVIRVRDVPVGEQVSNVDVKVRTSTRIGWYCGKCKEFYDAIGRERKMK